MLSRTFLARLQTLWIAAALLCVVPHARAVDLETRFPIDDANPEGSVPTQQEAMKAPLQMGYWVMLISERAEGAEARNDFAAAVKYYRALAKAVPDRATAYGKMCKAYEALDDRERAIASCKAALAKGGAALEDATRLSHLLLAKPSALDATEKADVEAVIAHLESGQGVADQTEDEKHNARLAGGTLRCELALKTNDAAMLGACVAQLKTLAPKDPRTFAFGFAHALMNEDTNAAASVIEKARAAAVPAPAISAMEQRLKDARATTTPWWPRGEGFWIAALALLALLSAALLTRRALRVRAA